MKSLKSYWRKFKAEHQERRAFNRSESGFDPEWREARLYTLLVKYEEGFIEAEELLTNIRSDWETTGLDCTIDTLLLKQRGTKPKVNKLANQLLIMQNARVRNSITKIDKNKLEEEKQIKEKEEVIAKQEAFDNTAFIKFLEH